MKSIIKFWLIGLISMLVITFALIQLDDAFDKTGVWYKDIFGSIKYYILWIVPYWWFIILVGSCVIGLLSFGVTLGLKRMRK
ncbi:MAG TPA: hypothetical protein PLC27_04060 [Saprospiraceae bacterium]|nr:hypothetical protein [Saprospiraceae bacterium]HRG40549.1 hypothetical protein [Saprospiraceae bacterium]